MSLKLYVVRHGQSEANLAKVFYNDSETKLTRSEEHTSELQSRI